MCGVQTLRVRRIYDPENKTLLYVAYTTHLAEGHDDAGRYKYAFCHDSQTAMLARTQPHTLAFLLQHENRPRS